MITKWLNLWFTRILKQLQIIIMSCSVKSDKLRNGIELLSFKIFCYAGAIKWISETMLQHR